MATSKKPKSSNKNSVKTQVDATSGLESAFATRTAGLEETDKLYERANKKLESQLATQKLINKGLKEAKDLTEDQATAAGKLTKMWGEFESISAQYHQDVKDGIMTQEQANKKLKEMRVGFDRLLKASGLNTKENKDLLQVFKNMGSEMKSVEKAYDKTAKKAALLNSALDNMGSSGIPLLRELGDVLKNIGKDADGTRMAMTALGAAIGGLSMKYFGAEMEAGVKALNDAAQNQIDGEREVLKLGNKRKFITQRADLETKQNNINTYGELNKLEQKKGFVSKQIGLEVNQNSIDTANTVNQLTNEAAYASQKAAIQFSAQLQTGAAEFKAAAKTALYGKGIGSIGYGAAQMQLAGIGAENVAASLTTATKVLGTKVTSDVAADMAVLEKRTGQSSDNISGMMSFFKRMGKLTDESALNMTEGMRAMADSAGIDLGGYMEEVAQASKEALGYQIKSGPALQKQVAYAQQLGVSFGDIAKAGKSMVLNYKDSIKSEMSLSAMLGKNVNLSEARALFAQGKTDDALKSIKAQGLDPSKMNMFQQEALSKALGGMDLDSIQKIATGSATDVSAQTGNVKAGNKGFLKTTQSAQSTLASQTASISAQTAIIDAELSGKITKAYLQSDGYKQYQTNLLQQQKDQAKLENEITNSYLKSPAYAKYQSFLIGQQIAEARLNTIEENKFITSADAIKNAAESAKLAIERMFNENWRTGLATIAGGVAGNVLSRMFGGVQKVEVVNMSGSDITDMLDGDGPKKRGRKPGRPRTSRTKIPKTKIGRAKAVLQEGVSLVKDFFSKTKSNVNIPKDVKTMTKVANNPATKSALKNTKGLSTLTKLAPKLAKFTKFGGPAMNVLMAGADYKMRKDEGQTTTQAAVGTGAGLVGALAGAKGGALVGASIGALFGGVGAVPGAFLGGLIGGAGGYFLASSAADYATGAGKKPSVAKPPAKGASSVSVPGGGTAAKPSLVLSDEQYQTRLQTEMVALLGLSTGFLKQLLEVSAAEFDRPINLNGTKLNSSLLISARKNYAINRRETIGSYKTN